jgi:hydroxymethylpyrimidine pyrophosphatase-like HAD family hydrolase
MRYLALATDYDGTAASEGRLSDAALSAIERMRTSGRRVVLVTGRRVDDLLRVLQRSALFDLIVAENGAVIYDPQSREEVPLAAPLPALFAERLRERGVAPLEQGAVVVATRDPYGGVMLEVIRELGLEVHVIFNRGAVMALPAGINKATGLDVAVRRLGMSRHEVVGIGDAENDHSLLEYGECGVAVANAVDSLKEIAAFVTRGANGTGVAELIDELIENDLHRMEGKLERHLVMVGKRPDGPEVRIPPYGRNLLIAGPSGTGKSTLTAGLIERLIDKAYQVCIIDPEGDYSTLQALICLGNQQRAPNVNEVLSILEDPTINLNVNLLGLRLEDRPFFLAQLIPGLQAHCGRAQADRTGLSWMRHTTCCRKPGVTCHRRFPAGSARRSWSPYTRIILHRRYWRRSTWCSRSGRHLRRRSSDLPARRLSTLPGQKTSIMYRAMWLHGSSAIVSHRFRCRLNTHVRSEFVIIASTLRAICDGTVSTFAGRTTGTI